MEDFIFTPIVLAVGLAIHAVVLRYMPPQYGKFLSLSFGAHVVAAFFNVWLYQSFYAGGDTLAYYQFGRPVSEALAYDFESFFPETLNLFVQGDHRLPFELIEGGTTSSMQAVAIWLLFFLGNSFVAATVFVALCGYISKIALFIGLKPFIEERYLVRALIAVLLLPSFVVWTSVILKEPILMLGFGPATLGLSFLIRGKRLFVAALLLILGLGLGFFLKPYVIIVFTIAGAVWMIWERVVIRRGISFKPLYFVLGVAAALISATLSQQFFSKGASADRTLSEAMAYNRRVNAQTEGGSNFYLEGPGTDPGDSAQATTTSQAILAPLALGTALFRPFLFEARNPVQFLNGLEMTLILWLTVKAFRSRGIMGLLRFVMTRPFLVFCLVFVLLLALGTGLSTSNLGTLSRYRAPMMPFFVLLLLTLQPTRPASRNDPRLRNEPGRQEVTT